MADKPEFVDLISEATHQSRRRSAKHVDEPEVKERSRLSTWPPDRWVQWRLGEVTAGEVKAREFQNWGLGAAIFLYAIQAPHRAFSGKVASGLPQENALLLKVARILFAKPVSTFAEYA